MANTCAAEGPKRMAAPIFPLRDLLPLLHQLHRVMMDGMGDLVTQSAGEFIGVFHEVQERIDHVDIAAWSRESIGLSFMDEIELEGVVVSRLCCVG